MEEKVDALGQVETPKAVATKEAFRGRIAVTALTLLPFVTFPKLALGRATLNILGL